MIPTYENTKPLYEKLGLKPGFGSFKSRGGYACPLTIHTLAKTEIGKMVESQGNALSDEFMGFAVGFDQFDAILGGNLRPFPPEAFKAGQELRKAFERDGHVGHIYSDFASHEDPGM